MPTVAGSDLYRQGDDDPDVSNAAKSLGNSLPTMANGQSHMQPSPVCPALSMSLTIAAHIPACQV